MQKDKEKRTTVHLPTHLKDKLKLKALNNGETIQSLVTQAVKKSLQESQYGADEY